MSVLLEYICPRCTNKNDSASTVDSSGERAHPKPGDIGLCIYCAAPLEFRRAMPPKWLSYEELMNLRNEYDKDDFNTLIRGILLIVTMQPSTLRRMQ